MNSLNFLAPLLACLCGVLLGCAVTGSTSSASDTEEDSRIKAQRKKAAQRQRRIIYHNDGGDIFEGGATVEGFLAARMKHGVGSQVDTIVYNTGGTGMFHSHLPQVGDMYGENLIALRDAGHDPLNLIIDYCRQRDLEIIYSAKLNDIHDSFIPEMLSSFKKEHPEYCLGRSEDVKRPGHDVRRYYRHAVTIEDPSQLGQALIERMVYLFSPHDRTPKDIEKDIRKKLKK